MKKEVRWLVFLSILISILLSTVRVIVPFKVIPFYATTLMKLVSIFNVLTLILAIIIFLGLYFEIENKKRAAGIMPFVLLAPSLIIFFGGLIFMNSTDWGWLAIYSIIEWIGLGGFLGFVILLALQYFIKKYLNDEERRMKIYKISSIIAAVLILIGFVVILLIPNDVEYYNNKFRDVYHKEIYPSENPELIFAACQEIEKRNIEVWTDKDCYNRYGEIANDPEYCKEAYCISEIARKTKNPQLCFDYYESIINKSANKETKFDICLMGSIVRTQEVENCGLIEDERKAIRCALTINVINSNNLSECEGYNYSNYRFMDPQYCDYEKAKYQLAINNLNVSMCFDFVFRRIECAAAIANLTQDISYCDFSSITNFENWDNKQSLSEECISKVAAIWKDPTLCDEISLGSEFYDVCLFNTYSNLEEIPGLNF